MTTIEATEPHDGVPHPVRRRSRPCSRHLTNDRVRVRRSGDLPALKLGGRIVIPTQVIDDLLERASAIPDA